jgi:hypothetical protein
MRRLRGTVLKQIMPQKIAFATAFDNKQPAMAIHHQVLKQKSTGTNMLRYKSRRVLI